MAVLGAVEARAQESTTIELQARISENMALPQSDALSGFSADYLNLAISGNITDQISVGWRQRFNKAITAENPLRATDMLYLAYNPTPNWSFTFGQQTLSIGGWEYDSAPINIYLASEFWNNIACYQFGASGSWTSGSKKDNIMFQFCESPFRRNPINIDNKEMFAYNLMWTGSHGCFSSLYSVNFIEYLPGRFINYIALGNRFTLGDFRLDLDLMNRALNAKDFFGKETSLTVSGQLEGELGAMALGEIYTFGPTFRAENSNTPRHLAEFWMIEPEMAFYDIKDNMDLAEEFIKYLVKYALDNCYDDIKFLNDRYDNELIERLESVADTEFVRLTYTEGVKILEAAGVEWEYPVSWGTDLQSEHERYLVEKHFKKPVILTDYPKDIKAFYMKQNEDGKTVRAMDVLFPKIGEIIGGSEREASLQKLEARIEETGMSRKGLEWYLDTRRFGSAPHSGFGLGFERLLLFVTGMSNIRDVIPFPRTPKNAEY